MRRRLFQANALKNKFGKISFRPRWDPSRVFHPKYPCSQHYNLISFAYKFGFIYETMPRFAHSCRFLFVFRYSFFFIKKVTFLGKLIACSHIRFPIAIPQGSMGFFFKNGTRTTKENVRKKRKKKRKKT